MSPIAMMSFTVTVSRFEMDLQLLEDVHRVFLNC